MRRGEPWSVLVSSPGRLTQEFLARRRRRDLHPFRLDLVLSVPFALLAGPSTHCAARTPTIGVRVGQDAGVGADAAIDCDRDNWLCERLERRSNLADEVRQGEPAAVPLRLVNFAGYGMFMPLPAYAPLPLAGNRNRRRRDAEHPAFARHLHVLWFLGPGGSGVLAPAALAALMP